jgi:hypothetical protein
VASTGPRGRRRHRHAYVIDPDGAAAEIDLATLTVSHHHLTREHSLLARLDDWLEPSADAKGRLRPDPQHTMARQRRLLIAGSNMHDTGRSLVSDPAGLELVDTRSWTVRTLDTRADSFAVADRLLLATGTRRQGNTDPTGMGLVAYGRDGNRRFALLAGQAVWLDTTRPVDVRAEIGVYGRTRWFVVDLRTGQIAGASNALPTPLLGRGNRLGESASDGRPAVLSVVIELQPPKVIEAVRGRVEHPGQVRRSDGDP